MELTTIGDFVVHITKEGVFSITPIAGKEVEMPAKVKGWTSLDTVTEYLHRFAVRTRSAGERKQYDLRLWAVYAKGDGPKTAVAIAVSWCGMNRKIGGHRFTDSAGKAWPPQNSPLRPRSSYDRLRATFFVDSCDADAYANLLTQELALSHQRKNFASTRSVDLGSMSHYSLRELTDVIQAEGEVAAEIARARDRARGAA